MDALRASYGDSDSDSDSGSESFTQKSQVTSSNPSQNPARSSTPLPPPPLALLEPSSSLIDALRTELPNRVRSFPHVEGNYALHVYIPVFIPPSSRKELIQFCKKVNALVPGLHMVDHDLAFNTLLLDENKFEQLALGKEFHISLGRTVPIRVHQRDSVLTMLRQKLHTQKRYWIDFNKWEVFVNDDHTRTFLSMEVTAGGVAEITKQIEAVNEVYKLHNLPEFYKDPRPHISVAWVLGDMSEVMKRVLEEETKRRTSLGGTRHKPLFACKFGGVLCRIGNRVHEICRVREV
ncbi:OLC1v1027079C1 [Oldenlandia corymbosa var. corymbosa]|uniref:U6 snRNA phosphodiesterase n=1 Tax=Oldenlandia corymbosa var. corymbosa TaxID=529605 RepID=A0AAV1C939_OLDCO|nr:OLC1v1027079C1 [Oldenlandia corymbosa var. corymbosa]